MRQPSNIEMYSCHYYQVESLKYYINAVHNETLGKADTDKESGEIDCG